MKFISFKNWLFEITDAEKTANEKIRKYTQSKEISDKYPHWTHHGMYRIINSIEKNGYYEMEISPRWLEENIDNLLDQFDIANITYEKIKNEKYIHGEAIKIYNLEKDPNITEKILSIIEKTDPAGNVNIFESKKESKKLEYGCVMYYTDIPDWNKHISIIDKEDIYDDELHDYGLEKTPHCTALWGIHLDETTPEEVKEFIKTFKPIEVTINKISYFECDDYDVVKYEVPVTEELLMYHDLLLRRFPNTQTFPDYEPHMTIAYVNKGEAKKYAKKVKPFKVYFDEVVYSYKENKSDKDLTRIKIKLK